MPQANNLLGELRRRNIRLAQAVRLSKEPLKWIHVMPIGRYEEFRGLGPGWGDPLEITAEHIQQMVANFARYGHDVLIDYEHAHLWGETRAAGWIAAVEGRADGLWAEVRWTTEAQRQIAEEIYRYLSPSFDLEYKDAASGERIGARLLPVALTNDPFFEVGLEQKIAARETSMDELKKIAAALGLPETATLEDILAAIAELQAALAETTAEPEAARQQPRELPAAARKNLATLRAAAELLKTVRKELQLSATADGAAITAALKLRAGDQTTLAAKLAELETTLAVRMAEELVAAAVAEGKLAATLVPWAKQFAQADPAGFTAWAASAPRVVPVDNKPRTPAGDAPQVTERDRQVAAQYRLPPEQVAAARAKRESSQP